MDWGGIVQVDACLSFDSRRTPGEADRGSVVFLFVGQSYFTFANKKMIVESQSIVKHWGIKGPISAAFQWSKNGVIYLVKGEKLQLFLYSQVSCFYNSDVRLQLRCCRNALL